jgi:hypothetical protein
VKIVWTEIRWELQIYITEGKAVLSPSGNTFWVITAIQGSYKQVPCEQGKLALLWGSKYSKRPRTQTELFHTLVGVERGMLPKLLVAVWCTIHTNALLQPTELRPNVYSICSCKQIHMQLLTKFLLWLYVSWMRTLPVFANPDPGQRCVCFHL